MLRPAITGDYFLTAVPTGDDARAVHLLQREIAAATGGSVEEYVHLTLQRFEVPDGCDCEQLIGAVETAVRSAPPADVIASSLFATYHRYFQSQSVRWRVDPTPDLGRLTLQSAQAILHKGGVSHWPNAEAPLAQFMTAVWLPAKDPDADPPPIPDSQLAGYPRRLMTVSHIEVTKLVGEKTFETLRTFDIGITQS